MMPPERIALQPLLTPAGSCRLAEIAARIEAGAVFIYPTETIYGIGGRYDRTDVYERILSVKERAADHPMILLGAKGNCFSTVDIVFPPSARHCAEVFWPGLLTMVLPSPSVPGGIAVRVSNHPFIVALAGIFIEPLFSTSANISGETYQHDPDIIYEKLGSRVDFMIDAGFLPPSLPSTIVRVSIDNEVTVVREGCIPAATILSVANR